MTKLKYKMRHGFRAAVSHFFRHRQHPVKMLDYTSKNLWLLLIPLTKYLIASRFDFQSWIRTNWVDILSISGIFALAVLRWIFVRFTIESDGITAHTGLFGIVRTKVYYNEITTLTFCQSWINRPVKAYTMYIETNARTLSSEDMRLVISKRNADLLFDFVRDSEESAPKVTFSPRKTHLLMFSLLFSSAFSGMLLYGMFMFEAYKIIGLEFEQKLMLKVNSELTRIDSRLFKLSQTIPKAVLALGGLVIGGWFISFIATLARHWSFTISRTEDQLLVKSGVLIKRRHIINRSKINYYDLQQTLLMKAFKICSVTLDCTGYGKSRREISALIPITTYQQMNASLKMLVPDLPKPRPEIKTGRENISDFVWTPMIVCAIPPAALYILNKYVSIWQREFNILLVIITIPLIWLIIVKVAASFNTSVGFNENGCAMSYCKLYQFHKVFLPKANISKIRISRTPFQLLNNRCTLMIYTCGEKEKCHKMKFMPYDEIKKICLREGYIMFE